MDELLRIIHKGKTNILSVVVADSALSLFFVLLFGMLFLGDGAAPHINTAAIAITIIVFVARTQYKSPVRILPKAPLFAWSVFLLYVLASSVASIDVAVSLRASMRYVEAFLIYYAFCVYSKTGSGRLFVRWLLLFGALALLASAALSSLPTLRGSLPSMNLLWSGAGHNHITDIVLLLLVPSLSFVSRWPKARYVLILFLVSVFVLSGARAALVVALITIVAHITWVSDHVSFSKRGQAALLSVVIAALTVTLLLPEVIKRQNVIGPGMFAQKNTLVQERRIEYWRQAIYAIRARPIFGSGPGTFGLLSYRYQKQADYSSWFAHNYLLEITAETGLVGAGLFFAVLYVAYLRPVMRVLSAGVKSGGKSSLLLAPLPVFLYSLIDFSLNYFVIWILVWAIIGVATRYEP